MKGINHYVSFWRDRIQPAKEWYRDFKDRIGEKELIIFGCGNYGMTMLKVNIRNERIPIAMCDNNLSHWFRTYFGVNVMSPEDACIRYPNAFYLVASKNEGQSMLCDKNHQWIYTYDYAPDSIWEPWRTSDGMPEWIAEEADAVARRVRGNKSRQDSEADSKHPDMVKERSGSRKKEMLCFLLLADSHFTYNGTWDDTVASMMALAERLSIDGVIHLGDLTDGLLPLTSTKEIEGCCMEGMKSLGLPVYVVPGNHDYNYFRGNQEIRYPFTPQYYIDEPEHRLRLIFLDSFDPKEELRYGFTEYCIHWVESVLYMMPEDYVAIIFSHVPPIKQLHAWSDWIRNSHILMPVLDKYADRILAYINGHSHCDHLFNDLHNGQFPIISINCAKCEYFTEHKPEGAVVPFRRLGDRPQESFDIMQVDTVKREIYFTRFGAGQDRAVVNHKAVWV